MRAFHLGFNMFALYFLGYLLEPAIGPWRFVAVYFVVLGRQASAPCCSTRVSSRSAPRAPCSG